MYAHFNRLLVVALCSGGIGTASVARAADADSASVRYTRAIGASLGVPQIIALSYEFEPQANLRLQAHVGSVLIVNSLGVRGLLIPRTNKFSPYAFVGFGMLFGIPEDDWDGFSPYAWFGAGLRIPIQRIAISLEISGIEDPDDFIMSPGAAVGILYQY